MAFHADTTDLAEKVRSAEPWVWPMTAAIVIGGSVLLWSLAGLFWLAILLVMTMADYLVRGGWGFPSSP